MTKNIKFNYLYRDAGNYKNFGYAIFSNPESISVDEIKDKLEKAFKHKMFFIAQQIDLKELFFEDFPSDDDISFHEFDGLEVTVEPPNNLTKRTIKQFIELVDSESSKGWQVFDPMDRLFHFDKSSNQL